MVPAVFTATPGMFVYQRPMPFVGVAATDPISSPTLYAKWDWRVKTFSHVPRIIRPDGVPGYYSAQQVSNAAFRLRGTTLFRFALLAQYTLNRTPRTVGFQSLNPFYTFRVSFDSAKLVLEQGSNNG